MFKRIITIGRQYGSGGREVGKIVAEQLGIPFYDQDIINRIASKAGYDVEFVSNLDKIETLGVHKITQFFMGKDENGMTLEDYVWDAQKRVISELCVEGPCVIVGRCADFILEKRSDTFSIFIYANYDRRVKRILENEDQYPKVKDIKKAIDAKDSRRSAKYYKRTGREWGLMENYDMCIDSGRMGVQNAADIICDTINRLNEGKRLKDYIHDAANV